jgi:hypothetical protein
MVVQGRYRAHLSEGFAEANDGQLPREDCPQYAGGLVCAGALWGDEGA